MTLIYISLYHCSWIKTIQYHEYATEDNPGHQIKNFFFKIHALVGRLDKGRIGNMVCQLTYEFIWAFNTYTRGTLSRSVFGVDQWILNSSEALCTQRDSTAIKHRLHSTYTSNNIRKNYLPSYFSLSVNHFTHSQICKFQLYCYQSSFQSQPKYRPQCLWWISFKIWIIMKILLSFFFYISMY